MKQTLWMKLTIFYLVFAFIMIILLNTLGLNRYENRLIRDKKTLLYKEAASISADYMTNFYNDTLSLPNLTTQIKTIGSILEARILIVNSGGQIISDTRGAVDLSNPVNVLDMDPDFLDVTFADNVKLKGVITEPMVRVVYRVIYNYQVRGYIVILSSMKQIHNESLKLIDVINICFFVFLIFAFILFAGIYYTFLQPINKLNKAALEYTKGNYTYPLSIISFCIF